LTAAGAVVLPDVAAAAGAQIAAAPRGTTSVEFVAKITQDGDSLTCFGFLTDVFGLSAADLGFSGPDRSETDAFYTAFADGQLTTRAVRGSVHALDVEGELSIYHRDSAGATFGDPSSFKVGTRVARYSIVIQDILTVTDPGVGLPTLIGDLTQRDAVSVGQGKFGRVGLELRLFATGLGTRANTDPAPPVASLDISGNLAVS
jgi:hypothetical protein